MTSESEYVQLVLQQLARFYGLYGSVSEEALVERLLRELEGKSFVEQLQSRSIVRIERNEYHPYDTAQLSDTREGFTVVLGGAIEGTDGRRCSSTTQLFGEWSKSVGHEIAHSFGFYLQYSPPKKFWPNIAFLISDPAAEAFCDTFARVWLKQGSNKAELEELLRKTVYEDKPLTFKRGS